MKTHQSTLLATALAALLAGGLAACGDSNKTAGQKVDAAVASTERKAEEIKTDIKQGAGEVKDAATQAAQSAKTFASDANITSGVNVALAKDSALSTFKIDVDTSEGRVALNGTAPDEAAKKRAAKLAGAVEGVVSVDNRLTVR